MHDPTPAISIVADLPSDEAAARDLASRLALPLGADAPALLAVTPGGLELRDTSGNARPIRVDLGALRSPPPRTQPIARAIGKSKGVRTVIDATAGLLHDASLLAAMGLEVTAVERSGVLHAMQADALRRAGEDPSLAAGASRLTLVHADALDHLRGLAPDQRPDAIYMDPMHPARESSALSSIDMRLLRAVVGSDEDQAELLVAARASAGRRVVVKRPSRAGPLGEAIGARPVAQIPGRSVRYEIYAPSKV